MIGIEVSVKGSKFSRNLPLTLVRTLISRLKPQPAVPGKHPTARSLYFVYAESSVMVHRNWLALGEIMHICEPDPPTTDTLKLDIAGFLGGAAMSTVTLVAWMLTIDIPLGPNQIQKLSYRQKGTLMLIDHTYGREVWSHLWLLVCCTRCPKHTQQPPPSTLCLLEGFPMCKI